jgi:hypothetical protein
MTVFLAHSHHHQRNHHHNHHHRHYRVAKTLTLSRLICQRISSLPREVYVQLRKNNSGPFSRWRKGLKIIAERVKETNDVDNNCFYRQ